ncbi:unnamed protein product, partial [marine sediment metagenome]
MGGIRRQELIVETHHGKLTRAGFTLLEVLVVMGMITLLLSMLLPGLAAARAQAK